MERGVVMATQRQPITGIRHPIKADDLLTHDSIQSDNNLSDLLADVEQYNVSSGDKRLMLEDAFTRKFPS